MSKKERKRKRKPVIHLYAPCFAKHAHAAATPQGNRITFSVPRKQTDGITMPGTTGTFEKDRLLNTFACAELLYKLWFSPRNDYAFRRQGHGALD